MTDKELLQQALGALQESKPIDIHDQAAFNRSVVVIEALRARLAQPEPEPVAWRFKIQNELYRKNVWHLRPHKVSSENAEVQPLYTAPPRCRCSNTTDWK